MNRKLAICALMLCIIGAFVGPVWAYNLYDPAVALSATTSKTPPSITLNWTATDTLSSTNPYTIYRRSNVSDAWVQVATPAITDRSWTDTNVTIGQHYEYRIDCNYTDTFSNGYLYGGIEVPVVDNRGKLVLVVDDTVATPLQAELDRFTRDLVADGWVVLRHDVSRSSATPASMKATIVADYLADPTNVKSVFIFGHLPIYMTAQVQPDGHGYRAWPADSYYGDMDGTWVDGNVTYMPSPVELAVGRVDMVAMPALAPATELDLLRRYLNKDHNFRTKQFVPMNKGMIDPNFGWSPPVDTVTGRQWPVCENGYRAFPPVVGTANVIKDDWTNANITTPYLLAEGDGGGNYNQSAGVCFTSDFKTIDPGVFTTLSGSYFGEWESADNLLRGVTATQRYGLTCGYSWGVVWSMHPFGIGETIGFCWKQVMNNNNGDYTPICYPYSGPTSSWICLLGDPTLRPYIVAAPGAVTATTDSSGQVDLSWGASADSVVGYNVYRSSQWGGPYSLVNTGGFVTGTTYHDSTAPAGNQFYMVRAIALQTTASGSYYNPSLGTFAASAKVLTPTFSQPAGSYFGLQTINMSCATPGVTVRYTTDGSTPSQTNGTIGTTATVNSNCTLKAIAYKSGLVDSDVAYAAYTISQQNWVQVGTTDPGTYTTTDSVVSAPTFSTLGTIPSDFAISGGVMPDMKVTYVVQVTGVSGWGYQTSGRHGLMLYSAATPDINDGLFSGADDWNGNYYGALSGNTGQPAQPSRSSLYDYTPPADSRFVLFPQTYWFDVSLEIVNGVATTKSIMLSPGTPSDSQVTYTTTPVDASNWAGQMNFCAYRGGPGSNYGYSKSIVSNISFFKNTASNLTKCDMPTVDVPAATYTGPQTVTISSPTAGATIRYTTNGTTPTETTGTIYTGPVQIVTTATLKAMAYKNGMLDSDVFAGTYTIQPTPKSKISDVKSLGNGYYVTFTSPKVATVASGIYSDGSIYISEPDRTNGLKVLNAGTVNLWDNLTLTGTTDTDVATGEIILRTTSVTTGSNTPIVSLGMGNKIVASSAQLVTVWGKVTSVSTGYFTIDDGSGAPAKVQTDGLVAPLVSVPSVGDYVSCTGPAAKMAGGVAAIRVRNQSDIQDCMKCSTPTFSPAPGTYTSQLTVTLGCNTGGATIRYTTDGADPSETIGTVYNGPVQIAVSTTLKVIAYKSGLANSSVATAAYDIKCAKPTFSPLPGSYSSPQTVTISSATPGATIRYTVDGSDPSETNGIVGTSATISADCTLKAIAYVSGLTDSDIASGDYHIYQIQCAAPTFSLPAGTYAGSQTVTISTTTSGATIRYTTDGTTPSPTNGAIGTSAVIGSSCALRAIAYMAGAVDSGVASAMYTISSYSQTWDFAGSVNLSVLANGPTAPFSMWAWGIAQGQTQATLQQANANGSFRFTYATTGTLANLYSYSIDDYNDTKYTGRNPYIGSQFAFNGTGSDLASQALDNYISGSITGGAPAYYVPAAKFLVSLLNQPNNQAVQTYHQDCRVRFTAPSNGTYSVIATWTGRKVVQDSDVIPVELDANGVAQYTNSAVPVYNGAARVQWSGTVTLATGQTIESIIKPGTKGDDYIQMDLTVMK